jgi:hypothetical protein
MLRMMTFVDEGSFATSREISAIKRIDRKECL